MTSNDALGLADKISFQIKYHPDALLTADEARLVITALRSPRAVPANGAGREAIAQVIDPDCFALPRINLYRERYKRAYTKADAILALASPVAGRAEIIEEVATALANWYPDNVSTNAFCAAIRSLSCTPPLNPPAPPNGETTGDGS